MAQIEDGTFSGNQAAQVVTNETLGRGLCFVGGQLHQEWIIDTPVGRLSEWRPVPSFASLTEASQGLLDHGR